MKIIDTHVHIYPEKISKKAVEHIGEFYELKMYVEDGSIEEYIRQSAVAGITGAIVTSVATTPMQVGKINNFLAASCEKANGSGDGCKLRALATLHPDLRDGQLAFEVRNTKENGFIGYKLHADFQEFALDGERSFSIFEKIDPSMPCLLHAGDNRKSFSNPERVAGLAKKFPHLTFIAAHFGGYSEWDKVGVYDECPNVNFDTSSTLAFITKESAEGMLKKYGAERFLFGTDFPMWNLSEELARFNGLKLSNAERELILCKNAIRIYKL